MFLPETHKDAVLATLMLAEDFAYLFLDKEFNIQFSSAEALGYGIPKQDNLAQGPKWLAALRPRLAQLFGHPGLLVLSTLDQDHCPVSIKAQVVNMDGVPRLIILLRRSGAASSPDFAPYHAATGLYSASFVESKIDEELERIRRFSSIFSLLALDFSPEPQPISALGDLLRIHFRAIDVVEHARNEGFLALLPGTARDQALQAGARLAALAADFPLMLPAPISVRYTAIDATAHGYACRLICPVKSVSTDSCPYLSF